MPAFDRIDGQFVAVRCTFRERLIFKRAGWAVDTKIKKWVTSDIEKARLVAKYAVGAAQAHLSAAETIKESTVAASWAEDSDESFPAPEGLSYMAFQKAGIAYAIKRERTLIADPPGLGKTIQAIGINNATGSSSSQVLIVCPASLKVNWAREWKRWDVHGLSVGIAMSVPQREPIFDENGERARDPNTNKPLTRTWTEHDWPSTDVVIVNYDMLATFDDEIKSKEWDLVICDEAHLLKTATTTRSVSVFGGKRTQTVTLRSGKTKKKKITVLPIRAKRHAYLTGTPILSKPVELWTIVRACDPRGLGHSWEAFTDRYCEAYDEPVGDDRFRRVTDGASNLTELNRLLRERFMVRRDKKAVLKELPDKTRELILLPKDKLEKPIKKELSKVEEAMSKFEEMLGLKDDNPFRYIDDLTAKIGAALDAQDSEELDWEKAIGTLSEPEQLIFTELSDAREEVALAKVGLVTDHVLKLVESEEPVILFAYHKSVITELKERLEEKGLRVGVVTGSVPPNKRQAVVDKFQDGELDVIIGNILAMGVGFTMTIARFVVFAELDWVPALIEQAEDRAWRNGQLNAVMVQHLVVDGSIEARMAIALLEKMGVIFEALDAVKS
ncbi:DNA helicase [Ruegeria phage RpAliso]|nr:DNA helicase [Ruegeria phage RpAliso]